MLEHLRAQIRAAIKHGPHPYERIGLPYTPSNMERAWFLCGITVLFAGATGMTPSGALSVQTLSLRPRLFKARFSFPRDKLQLASATPTTLKTY